MAEAVTSYIVENDEAFRRALDRLALATNDFRIPFGLIAKEFYRGNKKIFSLKSPGKYPDLSEKYKKTKKRQVGFIYPIMVKTGRLASSLVNANDPETVRVITKQNLLLGTDVPYTKFHQSDRPRTKIPLRKVVFIDGGPLETSKGAKTSGRRQAWLNIINQYILDNIENFEI
jgi:phage gpG-like protein